MEERKDHKIYRYTNKVNGKVYIGRTCTSLAKRAGKDGKGYKGSKLFYNAIEKYGWDNFVGEILEENLTDEEAGIRERYYIKEFKSADPKKGYNILNENISSYPDYDRIRRSKQISGEKNFFFGRVFSEEERQKMSENSKGSKNHFYGKHHSEETKKRISENRKGKCKGSENYNYGKHFSEETRKKMSESKKGKYTGEKHPMWGRRHSEESKRKMSENNKGGTSHNARPVRCLDTNVVYKSAQEACKMTGCDNSGILKCCKGFNKTVHGLHWEFYRD